METEKVILRIGLGGELLGQYNNVKHATEMVGGSAQCIYLAIWKKKPYRESFWQYGFIKKETEITPQKEETRQEVSCLRCDLKFLTHNKKINHICPDCNIINDNLWENNTVYKTHASV